MTYGNFQWPFDGQVKFMLWITMGVRGSSPGKFEKRLSKWCKSRHIWHIFVNVFTLLKQNILVSVVWLQKSPVANRATGSPRSSGPRTKSSGHGHRATAQLQLCANVCIYGKSLSHILQDIFSFSIILGQIENTIKRSNI